MKRKSILGRVAIIAMALTLATTSMMSGTLARYSTTNTATPYAMIAKWSAKVTDQVKGGSAEFKGTIDLAATATAATGGQADPSQIGTSSTKMIAPGTKGSYTFAVDVTGSEVPVLLNVVAKKNGSYTFPDHLIVKITGTGTDSTVYGELTPQWDSANSEYAQVFTSSNQNQVTLIGTSDHPQMLFKSPRDTTSPTQKKELKLTWEWPLDYTDYVDMAKTQTESTFEGSASYDTNDVGATSDTVNKQFGFDLVVTLRQSEKNPGTVKEVTA